MASPTDSADTKRKVDVFNDVILKDGRVANLRLDGDALVLDAYQLRTWVAGAAAVALAVYIVLSLGLMGGTQWPIFPGYVILIVANIWMRKKTSERIPLTDIGSIDVAERRIVFHLRDVERGQITVIPKSWQRERFLVDLQERAPAALAAVSPASEIADGPTRSDDDAPSWLPSGRDARATIYGAAFLTAGVLLGALAHLDASSSRVVLVSAWGLAALAIVIWTQDGGTRAWFAAQVSRVTETHEKPLVLRMRRGGGWREWSPVTVEAMPFGFTLVLRRTDLFDAALVMGAGCMVATALRGEISFLASVLASLALLTSGYPRKSDDAFEFLAEDVREFEDDHGRGTLRVQTNEGFDEIEIRYPQRARDRWFAFLAAHAPGARVHTAIRIRNPGATTRAEESTDLIAVHERLRALDEETRSFKPDG